ncbi:MAG: 5,6-dimethylbenzimidazole synthase [bacterium ADurb.Bin236]|nr:MAG: 5,6-dimethylbenzimidazole synthase [bacterium ADurb.Bin236]HPN93863.1 nitroreductase family protein [bacterium]
MAEIKEPVSLIEVIRLRRSVRKYESEVAPKKALNGAVAAARLSAAFGSSPSWNIKVILEEKQAAACRKAAMSGFKGKTNVWMAAGDIPGMVCVTANPDSAPRKGDKQFYLMETAMAFENFALAARASGLGTCWLGAFDEAPVAKALELPKGTRIVAMSPIGIPFQKQITPLDITGQFDRFIKKRLHYQRRPLTETVFLEKFGKPAVWDLTPDAELLAGASISAGMNADDIVPGLLKKTRFVSTFAKKDVEEWKLNWLMEAARLAPSSSNSQIWRFVIIRCKENQWRLESCAHNERGLQTPFPEAGVVIAAIADDGAQRARGKEQPYFMIDVPIAISHISLMAAELGLALNIMPDFHEGRAARIIEAPSRSRIVALISVGYPTKRDIQGDFPMQIKLPSKPRKKGVEII